MSLCGNNALSQHNSVTYRAVNAGGKTGFGTCSVNLGIIYRGVSLCGDNFLSLDDLAAEFAVRAFCKTGFCTCSVISGINYRAMVNNREQRAES